MLPVWTQVSSQFLLTFCWEDARAARSLRSDFSNAALPAAAFERRGSPTYRKCGVYLIYFDMVNQDESFCFLQQSRAGGSLDRFFSTLWSFSEADQTPYSATYGANQVWEVPIGSDFLGRKSLQDETPNSDSKYNQLRHGLFFGV